MIKITVYENSEQEYTAFHCIGHAEYAEAGEDIVCAAVSVLVINTINSLEEITGEEMEVTAEENSGLIRCFFARQPLKETSRVLIDSLVLGLTRIEEQYGKKHCRLHFKEV